MVDWNQTRELLKSATSKSLTRHLQKHPGKSLAAIGYVFETQNCSLTFEICAEFASGDSTAPDPGWNSGDFQFPAGLDDDGIWSELFGASIDELDKLDDPDEPKKLYNSLIELTFSALADLAVTGLFGNFRRLHFNIAGIVAGDEDSTELVEQRDQTIRQLIERQLAEQSN